IGRPAGVRGFRKRNFKPLEIKRLTVPIRVVVLFFRAPLEHDESDERGRLPGRVPQGSFLLPGCRGPAIPGWPGQFVWTRWEIAVHFVRALPRFPGCGAWLPDLDFFQETLAKHLRPDRQA